MLLWLRLEEKLGRTVGGQRQGQRGEGGSLCSAIHLPSRRVSPPSAALPANPTALRLRVRRPRPLGAASPARSAGASGSPRLVFTCRLTSSPGICQPSQSVLCQHPSRSPEDELKARVSLLVLKRKSFFQDFFQYLLFKKNYMDA